MSEYFILTKGADLVEIPKLTGLETELLKPNMTEDEFNALKDVMIFYFENKKGIEIPDILTSPTFMVSQEIRHLLLQYDEDISFKAIQLFTTDVEDRTAPLYWIPNLPVCDCLHSSAEKYGMGLLKELVINREDVQERDIFKVGGTIENKVIISLALAESLLRRDLLGIGLEEVKVR